MLHRKLHAHTYTPMPVRIFNHGAWQLSPMHICIFVYLMPFWLSAENNGMMLPNAECRIRSCTTFQCVAAMNHVEVVVPSYPNMETELMTTLEIKYIFNACMWCGWFLSFSVDQPNMECQLFSFHRSQWVMWLQFSQQIYAAIWLIAEKWAANIFKNSRKHFNAVKENNPFTHRLRQLIRYSKRSMCCSPSSEHIVIHWSAKHSSNCYWWTVVAVLTTCISLFENQTKWIWTKRFE